MYAGEKGRVDMIIESLEVGRIQCNCYIVGCEKTHEGVVIDPGGDADLIAEVVNKRALSIKYFICTHAHFDHVEGLKDVLQYIKAPILLHEEDSPLYENLPGQAQMFGLQAEPAPTSNRYLKDGDIIKFGELSMKVLHTPGHSPGSISLQVDHVVFTGDTIFAGSIGRTDLPGGSMEKLVTSAKGKILSLGDEVKLYPGHGPATTVANEKRYNPFLGEKASFFI
jgi:hydroxyacylglutathione hydrolase